MGLDYQLNIENVIFGAKENCPMIKWLAAVLGYMYFRFPGAILGFIIGCKLSNICSNDPFNLGG